MTASRSNKGWCPRRWTETLVFEVPLRATKAGKHPINGVIRVGYIHGTDEMAMVSLRLIANVTGTE